MQLLSHYTSNQSKIYSGIENWENNMIGDNLSYSYRDTVYNKNTYPSTLHYHDYYELVIFEKGDIRYVCESAVYYPKRGDIILIPPRKFHMSAINGDETHYKRHVFYLYPSAFDFIKKSALTAFLSSNKDCSLLSIHSIDIQENFFSLLEKLKNAFKHPCDDLQTALGISQVINLFYLLNLESCLSTSNGNSLPENILKLQKYSDANFHKISSVSEVAKHFFYSREHTSRLFKKYFDTSISDYIMKRRIAKSQALIKQGLPMVEVAYQVGFGSLSTFIRTFKLITNMTPSKYRNMQNESE